MLVDLAAFLDLRSPCGSAWRNSDGACTSSFVVIVRRLDADLKAEDARRRMFLQVIKHFRPHDICRDLELEHAAAVVFDQELENFHRIIPFDVKRAVDEFDQLRPVIDQVQKVRLRPLDIKIPHPDLDARQAELAAERTAPARLEIDDAVRQIGRSSSNRCGDGIVIQIQLRPPGD